MSSPYLLFLLKQNNGKALWTYSTKSPGLSNSVDTTVNSLVNLGINAKSVIVSDRNGIDKILREEKPTHAIIEAFWVTPGKLQLLKHLHPHIHFIVRNHSEVPFLAMEGVAFTWICEYLKMGVEVTNVSARTVSDLKPIVHQLGVHNNLLTYLPNIYRADFTPFHIKHIPRHVIHVGCFGAIRPMKNHVEQALAAIDYGNKTNRQVYFHINATRVEGDGSQPLKNLRGLFQRLPNAELIEHGWMTKTEFHHLLHDKIDLLLQCSLTESFNIVAADAILTGVPVVASPEIKWLSSFHQCDPLNVKSIVDQITKIFRSPTDLKYYLRSQSKQLFDYNQKAAATWSKRFY